ncbi:hypothetical protein BJP36_28755 [Moorena producens JHB]|uniref:Uncharacterized protein n=1 Tax=Moorena producens (strain JHB) TaxID=1454205 RepID=A0A1D9G746_MOOP1|nr:hypothetical protein [Moorena producens]AOY83315.1 hypothetical protein BJP36_28755 [Moorena producens JHB]
MIYPGGKNSATNDEAPVLFPTEKVAALTGSKAVACKATEVPKTTTAARMKATDFYFIDFEVVICWLIKW